MIKLDPSEESMSITTSTKLCSLFDEDNDSVEDFKSSLFYKPKQNRKEEIQAKFDDGLSHKSPHRSSKELSLFCASAVEVHKFENGKYLYAGKFGMALLGNDKDFCYRLILYADKQNVLCSVVLTENFKFICQANNYCSFYDDQRKNWSVMFENDNHLKLFGRHIAHILFSLHYKLSISSNSLPYELPIVIQNLNYVDCSNKNSIVYSTNQSRYKAELKLNSLKTYKLGQSFSENCKEILDQEVKSCCDISPNNPPTNLLFGKANPGELRYALISAKQINYLKLMFPFVDFDNIEIDKIFNFALEFEILNFKTDEEFSVLNQKVDHSEESKCTDKPKIASKTDLVSRMSKMGALPIFPLTSKETIQITPNEENINNSQVNEKSNLPNNNDDTVVDSNQISINQEFQYIKGVTNDTHSKVDLVLDKLTELKTMINESCKKESPLDVIMTSSSLTIDSTILLSSIQKIIDENGKLKQELNNKMNELEKLNSKIIDLIPLSRNLEPIDNNLSENGTFSQNKDVIFDLKNRLSDLKEENYRASMQNLQLEKKLLEMEKESKIQKITQDGSINLSTKQWKKLLRHILSSVYSQFNEQVPNLQVDDEMSKTIFVDLLAQSIQYVKKYYSNDLLSILENINSKMSSDCLFVKLNTKPIPSNDNEHSKINDDDII